MAPAAARHHAAPDIAALQPDSAVRATSGAVLDASQLSAVAVPILRPRRGLGDLADSCVLRQIDFFSLTKDSGKPVL